MGHQPTPMDHPLHTAPQIHVRHESQGTHHRVLHSRIRTRTRQTLMAWTSRPGRAVPAHLQQQCFARDRYTCRTCGYQGTPGDGTLNADHKHNRARGGTNTLNNLETLCVPCHKAKTQNEAAAGRAALRAKLTLPEEPHPGRRNAHPPATTQPHHEGVGDGPT